MNEDPTILWTREKEEVLKTYAEESECMYLAYTKEFVTYRYWGYGFTIPSIIISTVTGLLSFDQTFSSSSDGAFVIGSLNIFVAVAGTIYKVLKYGDLEAQFKFLASEHLKLYTEIQATLLKSPLDRDNANEFIRKIESRRMQLVDDAPVLSKETMVKFKRKYKNADVHIPVLLNKINSIKIFGQEKNPDIIVSESSSEQEIASSKSQTLNDVVIDSQTKKHTVTSTTDV